MPGQPPGQLIRVFISYSRLDTALADLLADDLRARGFEPWVDRSHVEGGENWREMIQEAIDKCQALIVLATPRSMKSEWVRIEYRYALDEHKHVIPLKFEECSMPMDLRPLQFVDFRGNRGEALSGLSAALARSRHTTHPDLTPSDSAPTGERAASGASATDLELPPLQDLYVAGIKARKAGDLESAATYFQQIVDRDPKVKFLRGRVKDELAALLPDVRRLREARLRREAQAARQAGEWGQEVGALEALLVMVPDDSAAKSRLAVAKHNLEWKDEYDVIVRLAEQGLAAEARPRLNQLWREAPDYGDPAGVAVKLGFVQPGDAKLAKEVKGVVPTEEAQAASHPPGASPSDKAPLAAGAAKPAQDQSLSSDDQLRAAMREALAMWGDDTGEQSEPPRERPSLKARTRAMPGTSSPQPGSAAAPKPASQAKSASDADRADQTKPAGRTASPPSQSGVAKADGAELAQPISQRQAPDSSPSLAPASRADARGLLGRYGSVSSQAISPSRANPGGRTDPERAVGRARTRASTPRASARRASPRAGDWRARDYDGDDLESGWETGTWGTDWASSRGARLEGGRRVMASSGSGLPLDYANPRISPARRPLATSASRRVGDGSQRAAYVPAANRVSTSGPFIWACAISVCGGAGAGIGLIVGTWTVGLGVAIALAVVLFILGYRKRTSLWTLFGAALISAALAVAVVRFYGLVPYAALRLKYFNFPLLGTVHVDSLPWWLFALEFTLPYALILMFAEAVGTYIVLGVFDGEWDLSGNMIAAMAIFAVPVGVCVSISVTAAGPSLGWLAASTIACICTSIFFYWAFAGSYPPVGHNLLLFVIGLIAIPAPALTTWLLCAEVFALDSPAPLLWAAGALMGVILGVGVGFTVEVAISPRR